MGNSIFRFLCGLCASASQELALHGAHPAVAALGRDVLNFQSTSQVPDGLSRHVVSSKKAQANWYNKLLAAWKKARPPPKTPEEAARFVVQTLKNHQKADVEVDAKSVADGDTVNVYVDTSDPGVCGSVPREVQKAAAERAKARAAKNYPKADALLKTIVDAGYRPVPNARGEEVLGKKYRIRLSGIDAPESSMPYGKEAKETLLKLVQGKCLKVFVYDEDRYGRCVGDIYCDGVFVQWEKQAQAGRKGLWASSNPQKPWEWRKDKRNGTA
ncbi:hypothetical protein PR202_ga23369 [Eleusine coracana subsp. coracana]|uniref:TNase-like domain-containing protein n=1 Tax=Eleusine coracana subsp. coracana TaxID=191504 RepID=A0AAV5D423_ELECO|nr:hypothetical protein PR202_ga23369 [Eleusine coracana subsp. coracana]